MSTQHELTPSFQQGSPEWLEWRKGGIGSSDAPAIMGISPWKTAFQLWRETLGLANKPEFNSAMERGLELEPLAREIAEMISDVNFKPCLRVHKVFPWMRASLDGLSEDGKIAIEIKCTSQKNHELAKNGQIPEYYYPQLQHQICVCDLEGIRYFSFDGTSGVFVDIKRDDSYINSLIKRESEFWECLQNLEPPELTNRDYVNLEGDTAWQEASNGWLASRKLRQQYEAEEENYRMELMRISGQSNSMGHGVKLSKSYRRGNIDYKSIPTIQGIDLEQYRKKGTEFTRIDTI